jgi:hypothetical protein
MGREIHIAATSANRQRGGVRLLARLAGLVVCALGTACGSRSYDGAGMDASWAGDQKAAIGLAKKEVARFATPEQCSPARTINCGTLALAYGSLAEYQILGGDKAAGETSLREAKAALRMTAHDNQASATGMIFRGVSEAYWKTGDKARAKTVIEEGRAAGGDEWLLSSSAAQAILQDKARARRQAAADEPPPGAVSP